MKAKPKRPRLIDDSAFLLQREKPYVAKPDAWFRSKDHRDWLNTLDCHICGVPPKIAKVNGYFIEAAHVRKALPPARYGARLSMRIRNKEQLWQHCPGSTAGLPC